MSFMAEMTLTGNSGAICKAKQLLDRTLIGGCESKPDPFAVELEERITVHLACTVGGVNGAAKEHFGI